MSIETPILIFSVVSSNRNEVLTFEMICRIHWSRCWHCCCANLTFDLHLATAFDTVVIFWHFFDDFFLSPASDPVLFFRLIRRHCDRVACGRLLLRRGPCEFLRQQAYRFTTLSREFVLSTSRKNKFVAAYGRFFFSASWRDKELINRVDKQTRLLPRHCSTHIVSATVQISSSVRVLLGAKPTRNWSSRWTWCWTS
jgi:hypothetical protein